MVFCAPQRLCAEFSAAAFEHTGWEIPPPEWDIIRELRSGVENRPALGTTIRL
jgi:hypothetical protein